MISHSPNHGSKVAPELTIVIPSFNTAALTKFCLRSLRRHTDLRQVRVVVVDNASTDGSAEYLRAVGWINLTERDPAGEPGPVMHSRALDEALQKVETPYVLVMHTDTIVVADGWLDFLLDRMTAAPGIAGVGSWKLEYVPPLKRFGKSIEEFFRRLLGRRINHQQHYLRSHCALYRTGLVREFTRGFCDGDTAGKSLHQMLTAAGYRMEFIESPELLRYLRHLNHATMILNPVSGDRKTGKPAALRRLRTELAALDFDAIMADDRLDR